MENGVSAEVHFAQKLAANEKKTRDRAIKRLNKYLSVRSRHGSGLSEPDLLKIWKGLFYCMWMQDKPLIQEELSQRITNLLHCFPETEDGLRFVKVFLETMSREWNGIDRLRLDKFMMMVRDMLHQTFLLLSKGDWQEDECRTLALSVYGHVMCAHEAGLPDGLKLHLADIFLYELGKVSTEQLTSKALLILLQPFIEFVLLTNKMELAHRIVSQIIYKVMKASTSSTVAVDADKTDEMDEDMEVDESNQQKVDQPSFHLDQVMFLKWMFDLAGRKFIRAPNRALVYKLMKKYSGLWDSNASSADQTSEAELGQSGSENEQNFVCDVRFLKHDGKAVDRQQEGQASKKRKKKKRKNEVHDDCNNIPGSIEADAAVIVKVKKRKSGNENAPSTTPKDNDERSQNLSAGNNMKTSTATADQNNSADSCARATCIVSRKRRCISDENDSLPLKKKKKEMKLNNEPEWTNILVRKNPKKRRSSAEEMFLGEPGDEGTLELDVESDTNSNARPKYRSTSPPKSTVGVCAVELVTYNQSSASYIWKKDITRLQAKSPPKARKHHVSSSECSDEKNISEDASLPSEKQLAVDNHDSSVGFKKTSLSAGNIRATSVSPKLKLNRKLTPVLRENVELEMSAPVSIVMKTPNSAMAEDQASSSGMTLSAKKKVIFDLRRNKANKFQDYLKSLAKQPEPPPFEPTKSPVAGILKSPLVSPAPTPSSSETTQSSSKRGAAYRKRLSAPGSLVNSRGKKKRRSLFNKGQHDR